MGSLKVNIGLLKDDVEQRNAIQAYTTTKDMLETLGKLKNLLSLHTDIRGF
ncbi:MAG: hypothetical protein NXY59_02820 [Aigarchaeota archaeon]|nr:hypothetical protein [Candidatus Pelearchaeum maunauluense]